MVEAARRRICRRRFLQQGQPKRGRRGVLGTARPRGTTAGARFVVARECWEGEQQLRCLPPAPHVAAVEDEPNGSLRNRRALVQNPRQKSRRRKAIRSKRAGPLIVAQGLTRAAAKDPIGSTGVEAKRRQSLLEGHALIFVQHHLLARPASDDAFPSPVAVGELAYGQ